MECKHCHAPLEEGSIFCNQCGMRQEEKAPVEAPAVEEISAQAAVEIPAPKKTWVKVVAAICCALLVLGLGTGIWYAVKGSQAEPETTGGDTTAAPFVPSAVYGVSDEEVKAAKDNVVALCDGTELTNSQLQVYYWMQAFSFLNQYGSYLSYFGMDISQPFSQQQSPVEEMSWEQFFLEEGLGLWHRLQAIYKHAEAEGYAGYEGIQAQLDQMMADMEAAAESYGYETVEEMLHQDMGVGCGEADYLAYMELYAKCAEYMDKLYEQFLPTEDQVKEYVQANAEAMETNYGVTEESGNAQVTVRHVLIQPEGAELDEYGCVVATDEQWAACEAQAQALLDEWKKNDGTEKGFAAMAKEHTADTASAENGGLYEDFTQGEMAEGFETWSFEKERKAGDTGLAKTEFGYHIMYFVEGTPAWLYYGTDAYVGEKCDAVVTAAMEKYAMEKFYDKMALGTALSLVPSEEPAPTEG